MTLYLSEEFPSIIEVSGQEIEVNTDFRVGLDIMQDFEDVELDGEERLYLMVKRLYKEAPLDIEEAIMQGIKFLNGGEEKLSTETESKPRVYSFTRDARLIYAAFSQTHGIDLQTAQMHWWKFMALFLDLGADTAFNSLVNLRKRHYEGKTSEEEEDALAEAGGAFDEEVEEMEMSPEEIEFRSLLPNGEGFRGK